MDSARTTADIEFEKYQNFKKEIKERNFKDKIDKIYKKEFESSFNQILILSRKDFFSSIQNTIKILLIDMYSDNIFKNKELTEIQENCEKEIEKEYNNHYNKINKGWENYLEMGKRFNNNIFLSNYRKHCVNSDDFAYHNCQKESKFIIVNEGKTAKYVICINCQNVYFSNNILCNCSYCKVDYYSNILEKNENPNLLLATWRKYHCSRIINEKMKCIKCKREFYLNLKTKMLNCLNPNCKFISSPLKIIWRCVICNKEFKSDAIVYNPLEYERIKSSVKQALIIKHKAHPRNVPCCFLNVYNTNFKHNERCDGNLLEGEFNNKSIIVCEKCKAINLYERFVWTCPNCNCRFKDGGKNFEKRKTLNFSHSQYSSSVKMGDEKKFLRRGKTNLYDILNARKYGIRIKTDIFMKEAKEMLKEFNEEYDNPLRRSNFTMFEGKNYNDEDMDLKKSYDFIYQKESPRKTRNNFNNNLDFKMLSEEKERERKEREEREREREEKERKEREEKERKEREEKERKEREEREKEEREEREKEEKERKEKEEEIQKKREEYLKKSRKNMFDELIRKSSSNIIGGFHKLQSIKEERNENQLKARMKNDNISEEINPIISSSDDNDSLLSEESEFQTRIKTNLNTLENNGHFVFENNIVKKKVDKILEQTKIPILNVDDYEIESTLGEGSYGVIYKVRNINDDKILAMKKIIAHDLEEIEDFHREYELVSICSHPNIMKIYSMNIKTLDITTYALYILMEMAICDWDKEIKNRLQIKKYYKENELISILKQLVNALLFMQKELKITHRDIKPQNILVFKNNIYKIADFGEAKAVKQNYNKLNTLRGTELYMSPALYDGLKQDLDDVSHDPFKSDVFSLGFCFMYAAFLNFNIIYEVRDVTDMNKLEKILHKHLKNKYSEKFIKVLVKMLEIDEKERFDFISIENYINENYPNIR